MFGNEKCSQPAVDEEQAAELALALRDAVLNIRLEIHDQLEEALIAELRRRNLILLTSGFSGLFGLVRALYEVFAPSDSVSPAMQEYRQLEVLCDEGIALLLRLAQEQPNDPVVLECLAAVSGNSNT